MTKHDFRFTPEDHERMKEALDNLSDNPTEEEAEAVLQACGTSGKEVVNEFIERLLKENLELKQELDRRAAVAGPRGDAYAGIPKCIECGRLLSPHCEDCQPHPAAPSSPTPAESVVDSSVVPDRIWIAPTTIRKREGRIYAAPGRRDNEIQYVRADLTACYPEPDGDFNRSWHKWEDGRCETCGVTQLTAAPPESTRLAGEQEKE